jgi:hypothetical protein
LRAEVIRQRKLLQESAITKEQVQQTEQAFVVALKRVHAMRYTVTETDIAITEAILGEKVLRMPALPIGGFSQTAGLTRFNGPAKWSIAQAPTVEKFFSQSFGRRLPITALGQSDTHNRLGFDHRGLNGCGSTSRQQRRASTSQLSAQVGHSLSRLPHRRAWFRHRAAYSYRPSFWTAHPLVGIASSSYASRENAPTVNYSG